MNPANPDTDAAENPGIFRVAAGGHRDGGLLGADRTTLDRQIAATLQHIGRAAPGSPRLVASLAEGADRLFAMAALALGWPVTAVLPFPPAEFARDFPTSASRAAFHALLTRADRVVELPGVRDGAGDGPAYDAANQAMLSGARALLTLWDGAPARGVGGTAEAVAQAHASGLPVLWIAADPPHALRLLPPSTMNEPAPWWDRLARDLGQNRLSSSG